MREERWLGYINSDEELVVVYVPTENIKRIYARKKFDKENGLIEYMTYIKEMSLFQ